MGYRNMQTVLVACDACGVNEVVQSLEGEHPLLNRKRTWIVANETYAQHGELLARNKTYCCERCFRTYVPGPGVTNTNVEVHSK